MGDEFAAALAAAQHGSEEAFSAKRRLDVNASYGCPFICRFCFHLGTAGDMQYLPAEKGAGEEVVFTHDRVNRWHSARYVVDLVKHAQKKHGVDFVLFMDENLIAMDTASRHKWLPLRRRGQRSFATRRTKRPAFCSDRSIPITSTSSATSPNAGGSFSPA